MADTVTCDVKCRETALEVVKKEDPPRTLYTFFHRPGLSFGIETIPVGSHVPWHAHDDSNEVVFCYGGEGVFTLKSKGITADHVLRPEVAVYIPKNTKHTFRNTSNSEDLVISWTFTPGKRVASFVASNPVSGDSTKVLGESELTEERLVLRAIAIAQSARDHGNHPFGALLAKRDDSGRWEVLLESENTVVTESDASGHAETNLVRYSSARFDREFLKGCTLFTSTEPCAMCSGAIYWSNIKRVVYGLPESELYQMTGDNPENPTMRLDCRAVFSCGQGDTEVVGPICIKDARKVHEGFWE